jgi:hypothetical protein
LQPESFEIVPAAIVPILEMGLQRFETPNSLTVDAAAINPDTTSKRRARKKNK